MKMIKCISLSMLIFIGANSYASSSEIYSPYKNGLVIFKGYCENSVNEKKLWSEIGKFSKSFLLVFPKIPSEQKSYLQAEFNSGSNERAMNISRNSFYKMNETYEVIANIEKLSTSYLVNYNNLTLSKKMEFIGRLLSNLDTDYIVYEEIKIVSDDLNSKGYAVTSKNLHNHWGIKNLLKKSLIAHLICYGENN
jgi:hypothetical protein